MLKKHEVRSLLNIRHHDTINEDLRALGWLDYEEFNWPEVRKLLEMRLFLGLKHGVNSREEFLETSQEDLASMFVTHGLNVEERFRYLRSQYQPQTKHKVTLQLVLDRE